MKASRSALKQLKELARRLRTVKFSKIIDIDTLKKKRESICQYLLVLNDKQRRKRPH